MIRRVISLALSIGAGLATVTTLTHEVGPVPPWLGFTSGVLVTLASMAQLKIRITAGEIDELGDSASRPGRRRRGKRGGATGGGAGDPDFP